MINKREVIPDLGRRASGKSVVYNLGELNIWPTGTYFCLGVLGHFCSLGHILIFKDNMFWQRKLYSKDLSKFTKILNYYKFFCIIFYVKIYYSQKESEHFGLEILVIHEIVEHIVLNLMEAYILAHL